MAISNWKVIQTAFLLLCLVFFCLQAFEEFEKYSSSQGGLGIHQCEAII
jgi:hypothetical protein